MKLFHLPVCSQRSYRLTLITRLAPSLFLCLIACGSPLDVPKSTELEVAPETEWGQMSFALTAEAQGSQYALRDAQFSVSGPESLILNTNDTPDATTLLQELESGEYTIELLSGYRLVEILPDGELEVEAVLETTNPQQLLITPNQTTPVSYLFRTPAEAIPFGDGTLEVTVSVEQAAPVGLFFSELMMNPAALSDSDGEWIEITNTTDVALDLKGCVVARDSSAFTVEQSVSVAPGEAVVLANSIDPGFVPHYTYGSLTLPNSSVFVLTLECGGRQWDSVTVDPAHFPVVAGASTALSYDKYSSSENDEAAHWCVANESYGFDYGSPGAINPACSQSPQ